MNDSQNTISKHQTLNDVDCENNDDSLASLFCNFHFKYFAANCKAKDKNCNQCKRNDQGQCDACKRKFYFNIIDKKCKRESSMLHTSVNPLLPTDAYIRVRKTKTRHNIADIFNKMYHLFGSMLDCTKWWETMVPKHYIQTNPHTSWTQFLCCFFVFEVVIKSVISV